MPIGIRAHPDKGVLLLPPDAPDPHDDARIRVFSKVKRGSVRIAGGHVGERDACTADAMQMVDRRQPLIEAFKRLAKTQALTAFKLLGTSAQQGLSFYWSITPTAIARPACIKLNRQVRAAAASMLGPEEFYAPDMQPDRVHRAELIDSLDEEMADLIRHQQAYAASARILQTAESLFDTLLAI